MKNTVLAIALALTMPAKASLAQEANPEEMMAGLTMIETNVQMAFNKYGIDVNPMELSLGQLALIQRVLTDPDADTGGNSRKSTIEFIASMR